MNTQQDNELGLMTWVDNIRHPVWMLERPCRFNGVDLKISIETEKGSQIITPLQRSSAKIALSLPTDTLALSAPPVLHDYEACAVNLDEPLEINTPVDIWKYVYLTSVEITPHESEGVVVPSFMMYGESEWDPEHGIEIRFRNGYADESDAQGHITI